MIPQAPTQQLSLRLDPGLVDQHRSLKECLAARIYGQRGGLTAVAGRLDMSPSHLSEVLAGGGERRRKFDLDELEAYIKEYGDVTPILWLVAKYIPDASAQQAHALDQLAQMAHLLPGLMAQLGANNVNPPSRRKK